MDMPNAEHLEQMRQVLDRIESRQDDTAERMARYDQMGSELSALEVSATSPDRSVTVTAGTGGGVKSVELRPEAMQLSNVKLGQTITSTIAQAVAEAARKQAAVVQEFAGDRLDVVGRVFKTQEQVFGKPADPEPERPKPPNRFQEDDEDGFGSVFDRRSW